MHALLVCKPISAMGDVNASGLNGTHIPTRLSNLNLSEIRSFREREVDLGEDYEIKPHDVLCRSRGSRETYVHPGNERLRVLIQLRLDRYRQASSRLEKTQIVKEVVDAVRGSGGHFVKFENGSVLDVGNVKAREKVGHALRAASSRSNDEEYQRRRSSSSMSAASAEFIGRPAGPSTSQPYAQSAVASELTSFARSSFHRQGFVSQMADRNANASFQPPFPYHPSAVPVPDPNLSNELFFLLQQSIAENQARSSSIHGPYEDHDDTDDDSYPRRY